MNAECGMRNAEFDLGVVRATTLPLKTPHSALRIPHSHGVGVGMVRIIAGEFKGRRLKTPAGDRTRPTADRVREAWLSILQRPVRGARALDLRSEEHTSELQSQSNLVCRLLLEKKKKTQTRT